jgi:hypothetical protein
MTFPEERKERKRKGEVLSGIIWRALLLCISSNNMLSTSEYRQEKENGTAKSHARFLFPFSSINRELFV